MDQTVKTFTSEGADARKWIVRIIMAVILGGAIGMLIVWFMSNLVVPWLWDVMGQASGLPTSFTQRPYDYPDLFISVLEFCIAGIVAVMLNYFLQRPRAGRVKPVKSSAATAPVEPARIVPQATAAAATTQATSPVAPPAPVAKPDPVTPPAPVTLAPAAPAPFVAPGPVARPMPAAPSAPPVANLAAKPLPSAPKTAPPKLKTPKEFYYNVAG